MKINCRLIAILFLLLGDFAWGQDLPSDLKTGLFKPEKLGEIVPPGGGKPYFVVRGLACEGCEAQKNIVVIRADGARLEKMVYPGKVHDRKTGALLFESEVFFGNCLRKKGPVYVAFQRDKLDRRKHLQSSVYIAEFKEGGAIDEKILVHRLPASRESRARVKSKECQNIVGFDRLSENFSITRAVTSDDENAPSDGT